MSLAQDIADELHALGIPVMMGKAVFDHPAVIAMGFLMPDGEQVGVAVPREEATVARFVEDYRTCAKLHGGSDLQ